MYLKNQNGEVAFYNLLDFLSSPNVPGQAEVLLKVNSMSVVEAPKSLKFISELHLCSMTSGGASIYI
jgi:hypothetical protein